MFCDLRYVLCMCFWTNKDEMKLEWHWQGIHLVIYFLFILDILESLNYDVDAHLSLTKSSNKPDIGK